MTASDRPVPPPSAALPADVATVPGAAGGPDGPGASGALQDGRGTPRIVVVRADGRPADPQPDVPDAEDEPDESPEDDDADRRRPLVDQPTKVMRIGTMIKQLLDEVRSAPLDEAARSRLAEIHARSVRELEDGLSPELVAELRRITLPLDEGSTPSDAELRIAHAQLVGWLEGLFHGIQTALMAQRMASQAQLAQDWHALPAGTSGRPVGEPGADPGDVRQAPGQYL